MALEGMRHLRVRYGVDPGRLGPTGQPESFYWPGSEQKRAEIKTVRLASPADFEAVYQGRPGARQGVVFLSTDMCPYRPPAGLGAGASDPEVAAWLAAGHMVVQAWDTASTTHVTSAYTTGVTALLVGCERYHRGEDPAVYGACPRHFDVFVLEVFRERLGWPGLIRAVPQQYLKWRPQSVLIEDRSSGISLIQSLAASDIPIQAVSTVRGKRDRAVMGIPTIDGAVGSVQGWYRMHRVRHPEGAPWLGAFEAELKDFSGLEDSHTDQVDSLVHLVTNAIRLGAAAAVLPTGWEPEGGVPTTPEEDRRLLSQAATGRPDARLDAWHILGMLGDDSVDAFDGTCGRCAHNAAGYCRVQRRRVIALDGCHLFAGGTA